MKTERNLFKSFATISMMVLLFACSSPVEEVSEVMTDVVVTYTEAAADGAEKYLATISIDGMSCEMMCGSKISSTLASVPGVKNTDIEFNGIEDDNFAVVEYDGTQISEQKLVEAVQSIANGIYNVKAVEVTHYVDAEETAEDTEKVSLSAPTLEYKLPNVFSAFARLF